MSDEIDEQIENESIDTEELISEDTNDELISEDTNKEESESEVIERAKKFGHISKEDWIAQGRDPAQYKTPEEFDKTGKVIEQLYTLKKKVDQRDREIQALIDYQQRTAQREYDRAKQDLEVRIAASKNDMDIEGVAHYTKELVKLEDREEQSLMNRMQQLQHQAQQAFIERNEHWFNDRNPDLKARAIEIDNEIKQLYPNATYDELAQMIEKRMQYEHPERVMGTAQTRSAPSLTASRSSVNKTAVNTSSAKRTFQGLPQELKDTYNATKRIVESRGDKEYTINDFIERLKKDGEL